MIRSDFRAPTITVLLLLTWGVHEPAARPTDTGQAAIGGVQSQARTDENSRIAHQQLLEKRKKGRIDVYFAGDSITRRWGTSDVQYKDFLANWTENFFGWNAANFGWGGDTVQNILWRLQNGELDDVHPKVIVLLAGANNLAGPISPAGEAAKVEEVTRGIRAILDVMQQKAPGTKIILMGILPRNDGRNGVAMVPTINRVNQRIAQFADGKRIRYVNINDKLANLQGILLPGVTVDGLHLSRQGYQIWADALRPILVEWLGPRAKEDHAPPPTGDPSVQRRRTAGQ